ncbi:CBS domain-containing protein [Pedobacter sp. SD-b]|uniref:CBS domain-containing protein n=1 Tax=Pedobacter segetis TaxID=2793069 RepID=A0ABS1BNG9_9SPHI|nr:CBS domain-containing protein [Pedobacter segetis]MBK0384434.1 CBS domain-containing protein [Pedobacter segetis]
MIASELISYAIPELKTSDTVQKVFDRMAEFKISHLPIVDQQQFLGLLSEDDLIEVDDENTQVGALNLSLINPYILQSQHIYDAIRVFAELKISVLPVLDNKMNYLGVIAINTMVEYMAKITSVSHPGGIILLEIGNKDNSLAHIAQIVESENAQILSSYTDLLPDSTRMVVTMKVNKTEISQIVAALLRYDYTILATYNSSIQNDSNADRFDALMNYLSF